MKKYEHWDMESKGTVLTPLPVSALNVLIFVIYEAFFMTALDKTIEILRNIQMKRALRSGYSVAYAPALVWCGKKLETRSIKYGKKERRGLIGWIRFWFYRFGWLYTLLYAIPAVALIYAQLYIGSEKAEVITGNIRGHLLHVDLEHLLETKEPDKRLDKLRPNIDQSKRSLIDSRILYRRVYEVDGSPVVEIPCKPGSIAMNSTTFEVKYFDSKEKDEHDAGFESTLSNRKPQLVTTSKNFENIYCNETHGKYCLQYQTKGPDLHIVVGQQTQDKNVLYTSKRYSDRYARIFLSDRRDWKKSEAETLIHLLLPVVNGHRFNDHPMGVIDAAWLLSLRKMEDNEEKIVPEECALVTVTTLTLPSIVILGIVLSVTVVLELLLVVKWLLKRKNQRTLLNESGTTKGLLWSYANELNDEPIGYSRAPEESPKVCVSTGSAERDFRGQELFDVRPAFRNRNHLEIS